MTAIFAAIVMIIAPLETSAALAASSGAAPVCDKQGHVVRYASCETRAQCDALSRQCPTPPKERRS
jgi:hypothetical protein